MVFCEKRRVWLHGFPATLHAAQASKPSPLQSFSPQMRSKHVLDSNNAMLDLLQAPEESKPLESQVKRMLEETWQAR